MQLPEMPLIKFIDGWETVEEIEGGPWDSGGQPGRHVEPLQRICSPR